MAAPPDEVDPAAVVPLAGQASLTWHLGDHAVLLPEGTTHATLLAARLDDLLSAKSAEGAAWLVNTGAQMHSQVSCRHACSSESVQADGHLVRALHCL